MPIRSIFWSGASNQDIHVLRGRSSRVLTQSGLNFVQQSGSIISAGDYLHDNNDVALTFNALFKGAPSAMGITVDQGTGQVTVDLAPRPLPKNNFIIEVTARDAANHVIGTEVIRVHIHTAVTSVALTPQTLTVRPAAATRTDGEFTQYRFTLRATFDDGTMGDLTDNHGVAWSTTPPDRIDPDFFFLIVTPGDGVNDTITVTATLPPALGGASATATMRVAAPWSDETNLPRATIIAGGGWPGTTLPDRAPNILFIGDGYTFADEPAFEQTVTAIVNHLKTDRLARPYDLLCTSMNFWRLFVPAEGRGISFRGEVYTEVDNAAAQTFTGYVLIPPEKPPPTGRWDLGHLFYAVGLPVPADAHKSADDLRGDWAVLVDVPPTRDQVSDSLIKTWKRNATRILVDELDDFPGLAYGSPPAANDKPGIRDLTLHPFRARRSRIDRLLKEVQSDDNVQLGPGLNIGAAWTLPTPRFNDTNYAVRDLIRAAGNMFICTTAGTSAASQPPNYASAREGDSVTDGSATFLRLSFDNSRFVVLLNPFPAGRALFAGDYVALSTRTGSAKVPLKQPSPGHFVLNMQDVAKTASVDTCRTLGHELGHTFNLGDEYVESKNAFTGGEEGLGFLNLQTEADTKNTAGLIDGRRIKWDWHRVHTAAVLRGTVEEISASTYRVPVIAGQARQFRKDDTVLLRVRIPGQPLLTARSVTISQAMQIAVAPSAAAAADYLVVQPAAGVTVTLSEMQRFTAGSIVFVPVGAPAIPDDDAPFATLVAKNIRRVINIRHEPLYKRPTSDPSLEEDEQEPNLTALIPGLPGRPFCFKVTHKIVGLYEGGSTVATGIFHPTGACIMRDHHVDSTTFCPVCRYVMVDLIDPTRHFEIDRDYDDIYPLK